MRWTSNREIRLAVNQAQSSCEGELCSLPPSPITHSNSGDRRFTNFHNIVLIQTAFISNTKIEHERLKSPRSFCNDTLEAGKWQGTFEWACFHIHTPLVMVRPTTTWANWSEQFLDTTNSYAKQHQPRMISCLFHLSILYVHFALSFCFSSLSVYCILFLSLRYHQPQGKECVGVILR